MKDDLEDIVIFGETGFIFFGFTLANQAYTVAVEVILFIAYTLVVFIALTSTTVLPAARAIMQCMFSPKKVFYSQEQLSECFLAYQSSYCCSCGECSCGSRDSTKYCVK